ESAPPSVAQTGGLGYICPAEGQLRRGGALARGLAGWWHRTREESAAATSVTNRQGGMDGMAAPTARLQAASVRDELARCGVTHIVWLPDSETGFLYKAILESPITLVPVCREGESMAIAAGLIMGGKRPVILIQSTGFFESGD